MNQLLRILKANTSKQFVFMKTEVKMKSLSYVFLSLPCFLDNVVTNKIVIVILVPNPDDPLYTQSWKYHFSKYFEIFTTLGVECLALPWLKAPLTVESSPYTVYIASLVWGYHSVYDRWNAWLHAWPENKMLINSKSLLMWNTSKLYLNKLKKAGVSVIPTLYVDRIDEKALREAATYFETRNLIVKPQIAASSYNIVRVLVDSDDFSSSPGTYN